MVLPLRKATLRFLVLRHTTELLRNVSQTRTYARMYAPDSRILRSASSVHALSRLYTPLYIYNVQIRPCTAAYIATPAYRCTATTVYSSARAVQRRLYSFESAVQRRLYMHSSARAVQRRLYMHSSVRAVQRRLYMYSSARDAQRRQYMHSSRLTHIYMRI